MPTTRPRDPGAGLPSRTPRQRSPTRRSQGIRPTPTTRTATMVGAFGVFSGTLNARNTIVADNVDVSGGGIDCSGAITSQGYNLIEIASGCTVAPPANNDIFGLDPKLNSLQGRRWSFRHTAVVGQPSIQRRQPGRPERDHDLRDGRPAQHPTAVHDGDLRHRRGRDVRRTTPTATSASTAWTTAPRCRIRTRPTTTDAWGTRASAISATPTTTTTRRPTSRDSCAARPAELGQQRHDRLRFRRMPGLG